MTHQAASVLAAAGPPRRLAARAAAFVLAAAWLLAVPTAAAAGGRPSAPLLRLESHGPDQGLPQSSVKALANDDQGFLWVATQDGLARFDGHRFEVWRGGSGPRALASGSIDAMVFDGPGRRLWLGTNDAGLEVAHLPSWGHVHLDRDDGLSH